MAGLYGGFRESWGDARLMVIQMMIRELIHKAVDTFIHNPNQFASGGLLLMAIGSVGALLRKVPNDIWKWFVHQTTVTLAITDDQKAYFWTKMWIENQRIMKRTRHMDVFNRGSEKYAIACSRTSLDAVPRENPLSRNNSHGRKENGNDNPQRDHPI